MGPLSSWSDEMRVHVVLMGVWNSKTPSRQNSDDDVIKWKHFPRNRPFVRGIHWSPVNSTHNGQWRGALMFSLIWTWTNGWVNNRDAGDLRRHHDISVRNDVVQHGHEISRNLAPLRMPLRACVLLMWLPSHNDWLVGYRLVITFYPVYGAVYFHIINSFMTIVSILHFMLSSSRNRKCYSFTIIQS